MLSGEKILITGPAGRIAFGLARSLVADNEVWGIARFRDPATREKVEALGVTTRTLDLASGDFGDLPTDFTYLLAPRGRLQRRRLRPGAPGERRGHRVRARALPQRQGGVGDVDGDRLQAAPGPLARLPGG